MATYLVTITKNQTAEIEVEAKSEEEAERIAYGIAEDGKANFYDDYDEMNVVDVECLEEDDDDEEGEEMTAEDWTHHSDNCIKKDTTKRIAKTMRELYPLLGLDSEEEDGGLIIDAHLIEGLPELEVEVHDTYLDEDDDYDVPCVIEEIVLSESDLYFVTDEVEEVFPEDITKEELWSIASALENALKSRKEKKRK